MKRITISLPEELAAVLEREAHRRRTSLSEIARRALMDHLEFGDGRPREVPFAGIANTGEPGEPVADRLEEFLEKHWADDIYADAMGLDRRR